MVELRRMRKVGGSLTLTIPKDMQFVEGDWIQFKRNDECVILRKVM